MRKPGVLPVVALLFLLVGCGKEQSPDTLLLAYPADIRGFDPAVATDFRSGQIISLVYDNLVRFDRGTELVPNLARDWEISEDGRMYTFHLVTRARFHDGTPIKAQHAVYSFQRILDPTANSPQSWLFDRIEGAKIFMEGSASAVTGLVARDDSTLVITLEQPFAPFIQYLAMPSAAVVNPRQVAAINSIPAGSGPWRLQHWERDGELVFVRNREYWGQPPRLEGLRIRILSEPMTRSAEFEAGNLDILGITNMELNKWKSQAKWRDRIQTVNELSIYYIGMNCSRPPFNDVRVRRAMNLALDREKILKLLRSGSGLPASGPVPPVLLKGPAPEPYPYDPAKARRLLKEAGYGSGLKSRLWVAGDAEMFHVLEAFQSNWSAVGIEVELLRSDWNVFMTAIREGKPDLYYLSWFADYPDGENFLFPLFHTSESMRKRNRYSNPKVDRLIEKIQALSNGSQRDSLISVTNLIIHDEAPWVFLWHSQSNTVTQPWIKGYVPRLIFNAQRYTDIGKQF